MELMSLRQVVKQYPIFSETSLRWQLLNRNATGLSVATVKIGRRVFIDKIEFDRWLENKREKVH